MILPFRAFLRGGLVGVFCAGVGPALAQLTAPTLAPAPNAPNVPRTSTVTATFNEPLASASLDGLHLYSTRRGGRRTTTSGQTTVTGNTLRFQPSYEWLPGETVLGTVSGGVLNASQQPLAAPRVFQFTAATSGTGRGRLIPPATNPEPTVGGNPLALALGDLDNDGDLDVVTANSNNNTVSVRLNSGLHSGNFVAPAATPELAVGVFPSEVKLADIDGDGDLDLLVVNSNFGFNGSISIRLNDGTGSFRAPATGALLTIGPNPGNLALGDIDGDGDLDLLTSSTASNGSGTVSVRLNRGFNSGEFVAPASNSEIPGFSGPGHLVLGDLDNDGDLDLVQCNSGYLYVNVRLNGGLHSGNFGTGSQVSVPSYPTSLALGDLDGDGDLDLVVGTGGSTNTANVRLNDGLHSARFVDGPGEIYADTNPLAIQLGDMDADGDLDVVTANSTGSSVSVRFNTGLNSGLYSGYDSDFNFSLPGSPRSVALGDVDGDGDLDVVATNGFSLNHLSVRLNNTGAAPVVPPTLTAFTPALGPAGTVVTLTGTRFTGATGVTFNGVPAPNYTVVSPTSITVTVPPAATTGPITVLTPSGTAISGTSFTVLVPGFRVVSTSPERNQASSPNPSRVAVTFSQPISSSPAAVGALRVFSTQRGGKLSGTASTSGNTLTFTPTTGFRAGETVYATVTRAARGLDSLLRKPYVYQFTTAVGGTGRGYFRPGSSAGVGAGPNSVAVGDVDGDGDLDLLTANTTGGSVSVRLNGGNASGSNTGLFSGSQEVAVSARPAVVALADVDNDGDLDLLVGCEGITNGTLNVRLNGGDATGSNTGLFSAGTDVVINSGPLSLAVGDVTGDGFVDIVTADRYSNYLTVLHNGGGSFGGGFRVAAGRTPSHVALGDVDGDGDLDLLCANAGDGSVYVRLNGGDATGSNRGTFSGGQDISVGYAPSSLALGDIDGDLDLDLLIGNSHNGATDVNVRLNGGDATGSNTGLFSAGTDVAVGGPSSRIALGDVDADGDLDLLTLNAIYNGSVFVYLNGGQATGLFTGRRLVAVGTTPLGFALADIDGDLDLDLLTANEGSHDVSIRLNTDGGGVLTSSAPAVCAGPNGGTLTLSFATGTVLNYQADTGSGYQDLPGTTTSLAFTNLTTTTTFRAVVRTPEGQTVYSTPVTVVVNPAPTATLTAGSATTFCAGGSVILSATGGTRYQFLRDGQPLAGATAATYVATVSGAYTVAVTNSLGCTATSAAITVTVNPRPATPTVTVAYGPATITLTSSASSGNQWYLAGVLIPGATAPTYQVSSAAQYGAYTVTTTDGNGCVSAASAPLVVTATRPVAGAALVLAPNPTPDGRLELQLTGYSQAVELTVLNAMGQPVYRSTVPAGRSRQLLDLSTLPAGMYTLRAVSAGAATTRRFVRQ